LTDFWRVGAGTARKLETIGVTTMEGIAHMDEDTLYHLFGIDAELLIDHAWGREPVTIADIKQYKPKVNSLTSGQVRGCDVDYEGGKLVVKEMVDLLCLEMVEKGLVTDSITLHIGYNHRFEKKAAHGTITMTATTSSANLFMDAAVRLYDQIIDRHTPIHRVNLTFNHVLDEAYQQYDLFTDPAELEREHKLQKAMLDIKGKFGKNAILKGMNLQEGATTMERNRQIGGHKSGE
jgi:DNA polymerase V